jgi:hypothetical protein
LRSGCVLALLVALAVSAAAQTSNQLPAKTTAESPTTLEHNFFAALRAGDARKVLAYVPAGGVNVGADAQHVTREQVEKQFQSHKGLYCRLFDSACIDTPIKLDNAAPTCSYRELLTRSKKARTAASEVTRNGVRQAVLVAQVENSRCPNDKLIDFIFNLEADGWKLFSIP